MTTRAPEESRLSVLFVLPTLGTGGSERVVFDLCRSLMATCRPVVVAFRGGALSREFHNAGIDCHILDRSGGIDIRLFFKIFRIIRNEQIKAVNSHHFVSLFYAFLAARLTRTPLIHTEHSRWEMEQLPFIWNLFFGFFLKRLRFVSAVSRAACDYLESQYTISPDRLVLAQNGVDINKFERGAKNPVRRAELDLSEDELIIGTVGNLRDEKNQALLIRALPLMVEHGLNAKAVLVGDGPCRDRLEDLAQQLEVVSRIHFLGVRHDVESLYGLFDVYTLTSRYEGLPLTLLEAMAAGIPVVGTDVLGINEVIESGHNGLLIKDNDPRALAAAVCRLATNPTQKNNLVKSAKRLVADQYSFSRFVQCYDEMFKRSFIH